MIRLALAHALNIIHASIFNSQPVNSMNFVEESKSDEDSKEINLCTESDSVEGHTVEGKSLEKDPFNDSNRHSFKDSEESIKLTKSIDKPLNQVEIELVESGKLSDLAIIEQSKANKNIKIYGKTRKRRNDSALERDTKDSEATKLNGKNGLWSFQNSSNNEIEFNSKMEAEVCSSFLQIEDNTKIDQMNKNGSLMKKDEDNTSILQVKRKGIAFKKFSSIASKIKKKDENSNKLNNRSMEDDDSSIDDYQECKESEFEAFYLQKGVGVDSPVMLNVMGVDITKEHIERLLNPQGWLTSQIIDARLAQLQLEFPQNLYFNTSFFALLCPNPEKEVINHSRIAGWTKPKRLPGETISLFDCSKVFIPINQEGVHWLLVSIDIEDRNISFFDSLSPNSMDIYYLNCISKYVNEEIISRGGGKAGIKPEEFRIIQKMPPNVPLQMNYSDCGIMVLHYIEVLSKAGREEAKFRMLDEIDIKKMRAGIVENFMNAVKKASMIT